MSQPPTQAPPTQAALKTCPSCSATCEAWAHVCPQCQYEWPQADGRRPRGHLEAMFQRWDLLFYWVAFYVPLNFYLFFIPVNQHARVGYYIQGEYVALFLFWFPVEVVGLIGAALGVTYRTYWVTAVFVLSTFVLPLGILLGLATQRLTPQPWGFRFPYLFGPAVPKPRPAPRPKPQPPAPPALITHRFLHFELDLPEGYTLTDRQEDLPFRVLDLRGPGGAPLALLHAGTSATLETPFREDLARRLPAQPGLVCLEQPGAGATPPRYRVQGSGLRMSGAPSPFAVLDLVLVAGADPGQQARLTQALAGLRISQQDLQRREPLRTFPAPRPASR